MVSFETRCHVKTWFTITCFTNVCCFLPSTWHISFGAHYAIFVFFSGCGIITCSIPFSHYSSCGCTTTLTEIPNKTMTSSLLNFMWLIGLELLFLQLSTYRMYTLMIETSKPQKNNFLHHFNALRRKSMSHNTDQQDLLRPCSSCCLQ